MTPESIPGLSLPDDLELWTPVAELDLTLEEVIAELEYHGEAAATGEPAPAERPAPFPRRPAHVPHDGPRRRAA